MCVGVYIKLSVYIHISFKLHCSSGLYFIHSQARHNQGMALGKYYYQKLLSKTAPVETLQSTMILVNTPPREGMLRMTLAQAIAAGAPVRVVVCLTATGQLPAETGQTVDGHSKQSTLQGSLTLLLDMYQIW